MWIISLKRSNRYCITGGIGSGKSYVCRLFRERRIEVFDCDASAKRCVLKPAVRDRLVRLIGPDAYVDGRYNKTEVAKFLLASEANKLALNAIIHPAVIEDFMSSGLQWMECAILYEANLQDYVDGVVAVAAPEEVRIRRIMQRDGITEQKAREWLAAQMPQQEVLRRADYSICNDGVQPLEPQIEEILRSIQLQIS